MHPSRQRQSIFLSANVGVQALAACAHGLAITILSPNLVSRSRIVCATRRRVLAAKAWTPTFAFVVYVLLWCGTVRGDEPAKTKPAKWTDLVGKWTAVEFGGEGEVEIDDKLIKLGMGSPLTGIRWTEKVPRENYELTLEARRTDGLDFFCGLTFPVGKDHVSFVLGGWGGGVVGISSIDGYDASENDTTMYQQFKKNQWYKLRVQITAGAIKCWIDDQIAVDQERSGHTFDIRFEMDETTPLGIAAFQCKSELRKLGIRKLQADEIKRAAAELGESSTSKGTGNE